MSSVAKVRMDTYKSGDTVKFVGILLNMYGDEVDSIKAECKNDLVIELADRDLPAHVTVDFTDAYNAEPFRS